MITLTDAVKIYDKGGVKTTALNKVSLEIPEGSFTAFMGPSGSGKTTLLNIIGGMDRLTGGSYQYFDICVEKMDHKELNQFRKQNISFVFQSFALMNQYTVYENVELPLIMRRVPRKKRKEAVSEILEQTGIIEMKDKLPVHLSGGQRQRCGIARALVADTPLILADEPTGALDTKNSEEIMQLFRNMHKQGKTIIIVTHDIHIAEQCERIINICDGTII